VPAMPASSVPKIDDDDDDEFAEVRTPLPLAAQQKPPVQYDATLTTPRAWSCVRSLRCQRQHSRR